MSPGVKPLSRRRTGERIEDDHDDGECGEYDDNGSATSVEAEEEGMRGRHLASGTRQALATKDDKQGDHD
jgi:hypothetical protein